MTQKDYLQDISEIKSLMNKSTRFLSLSGLAGILAGFYAIVGALIAYYLIDHSNKDYVVLGGTVFKYIILDLLLVALLSGVTAIFFKHKKS